MGYSHHETNTTATASDILLAVKETSLQQKQSFLRYSFVSNQIEIGKLKVDNHPF